MSSSSYSQGLQSFLEPARLVEPLVLRLKLAPSKSNNSHCLTPRKPSVVTDSDCDSNSNQNVDAGGWSFLQSLANVNNASQSSKEKKENDMIYVPPTVKRSSSTLSEKSLEMCTESLGSETGSDVSESSDEMALLSVDINLMNYETRERTKLKETRRKMKRSVNFPPPLTSITGSSSVQVRSHREGGRLVMEAVSVSTCRAYFHAERINGRLRLHLMKDCSSNNENDEQEGEEEEAEETEEQAYGDDEEAAAEDEMEGEDGEGEADDGDEKDMDGGRGNDGGEMGMGGRLARAGRCKEAGESSGKQGLLNWEPFWVAT